MPVLAGALAFATMTAYVYLAILTYDMAIAHNGTGPLKAAFVVLVAGVANSIVVIKVLG